MIFVELMEQALRLKKSKNQPNYPLSPDATYYSTDPISVIFVFNYDANQ